MSALDSSLEQCSDDYPKSEARRPASVRSLSLHERCLQHLYPADLQSTFKPIRSAHRLLSKLVARLSVDLVGAATSFLCVIHCAATPLLFAAKPLLLQMQGHHHHHVPAGAWGTVWLSLDLVFLALAAWAITKAVSQSGRTLLSAVLIMGWLVFALGLLSERLGWTETEVLAYVGSAILVGAHIYRYVVPFRPRLADQLKELDQLTFES